LLVIVLVQVVVVSERGHRGENRRDDPIHTRALRFRAFSSAADEAVAITTANASPALKLSFMYHGIKSR
jgi:hypothetical protein